VESEQKPKKKISEQKAKRENQRNQILVLGDLVSDVSEVSRTGNKKKKQKMSLGVESKVGWSRSNQYLKRLRLVVEYKLVASHAPASIFVLPSTQSDSVRSPVQTVRAFSRSALRRGRDACFCATACIAARRFAF
jgi:hypothetical protein